MYKFLIITTTFLVALSSCQEVGPAINLNDRRGAGLVIDTMYQEALQTPQTKNVLLEDFTGIRCINCPNAQTELKYLIGQHSGRLIGLSHHSVLQDEVYPVSRVELTSRVSQVIEDYLIYPGFKPSGSIDRANLLNRTSLCYDYLEWAGAVNTRLNQTTTVNLNVIKEFSKTNGELTLDVRMHYIVNETEPNRLTIFIVEDSIVTAQLMPNNTINENYVHDHVVRLAVSDTLGDKLNHDLNAGNTIRHVYQTNLSGKELDFSHLKAIVFVHRFTNVKEILHVVEFKL
jgi:hypothetical protein